MINVCVNNRLERKYIFDRKAYSEIEYCTSKDELGVSAQAPDWLMFAFYTTVLTLLGLLMGANVLDSMSRSKFKGTFTLHSHKIESDRVVCRSRPHNCVIVLGATQLASADGTAKGCAVPGVRIHRRTSGVNMCARSGHTLFASWRDCSDAEY